MENTNTKISPSSSSKWTRKNCIGRGSFGQVHVAINNTDNRIFAVKSVNSYTANPSHIEALENEIQILQSLSSPYVIQYLGNDSTKESSTECYRNLHMEYMFDGSVADFGRIKDEQMVRSYTRNMVSALRYIHSKGIVHCDVKGKNVLLGSKPGVAKLADFGSAKRISKQEEEGLIKAQGTPLWMAPEVIRQEKQGPESDVWSLGCTVIEMVTGKSAWKDCESTVIFQIGFSDELPEFPNQLSELGKDFLSKCLRREASERWSCEQLLRHPFISETDIFIESSPRSILDWANSEFQEDDEEDEDSVQIGDELFIISAKDRISELASSRGAIWESDGWEVVRSDTLGGNRGGEAGCSAGEDECTIHSEYSDVGGEYLELISLKVENGNRDLCSGGGWPTICGCKAGLSCQHGVIKRSSVALNKKERNNIFWKLYLLFTLIFIHIIKYKIDFLYYFSTSHSYK